MDIKIAGAGTGGEIKPTGTNLIEMDNFTSANMVNPNVIAISGTVAYVMSNDNIVSIDISNPSNMTEISYFIVPSFSGASGISISGTVAYIVEGSSTTGQIVSIDITTPKNRS